MKKEINVQIGQRVREARRKMAMSREELAELLGISTLFMGYIETGQRGMSTETLVRVCLTLGISADYLLMGLPPEPESCDAQSILKDLPPQYLPLAAEVLRNLQKTIATVRAADVLQPLPRQTPQHTTERDPAQ